MSSLREAQSIFFFASSNVSSCAFLTMQSYEHGVNRWCIDVKLAEEDILYLEEPYQTRSVLGHN